MATPNTKEKKRKFVKKYKDLECNISKTCIAVGISRTTFQRWIKRDKRFAKKIEAAYESILDDVEIAIQKSAKGHEIETKKTSVKTGPDGTTTTITETKHYYPPNIQAAKLLMDAKARHRGYGMKPDDSDQGHDENDEDE